MLKLFGKHYGTERFFIMIFACLLIIIGLVIYGGKIYSDATKQSIASTALYTKQYTWSRTSATGSVVSLIADKSKTKVFMLLKNDAFTSFDASDYTVFFTNYDKSETRINNPALTIYSYGASGYVGFYFTDARGFGNQVVDIWIRNDSAASDMASENTFDPNMVHDQSFLDHNQIQIVANFGASGIKTSDVFDGANVNQLKLFANTAGVLNDGTQVLKAFDDAVRGADKTLTNMKQNQLKFLSYAANLKDMHVVVPELPYYIANDVINEAPINFDKEPGEFLPSMIQNSDVQTSGPIVLGGNDSDNSSEESGASSESNPTEGVTGAKYTDKDGVEHNFNYYHTDCLLPGTIMFDYQGKLLSDGFITQTSFYKGLTKPDMIEAYDKYKDWSAEMKAMYGDAIPKSIKYDTWRKTNGDYVDMTNADMSNTPAVINMYVDALNEYLSNRAKYFMYFDNILSLEYKIQLLGQNTTINSGSAENKNIWVY